MICGRASSCGAARFADLVASVQHCNLCPRLCAKRKILSLANGNIESKVLFVAEAPGRLGADRTGVPLHGDRTGDNFESLLGNIGWRRDQVFITNAILCNPQGDDGTNGTPTADEIANCSAYLEMVIALVQPEMVVTLGATGLDALALISPHSLTLREAVAIATPWYGRQLFPLYHPGPRATVHRSLVKQRSDFMLLAKAIHPEKGLLRPSKARPAKSLLPLSPEFSPLQQTARALLQLAGRMTYFKLMKLLYLVDLAAIRKLGHMVAGDVYLRQVEGPWSPKLEQALKKMDGFEVRWFFTRRVPAVEIGPSPRNDVQLSDDILRIVMDIHQYYGRMGNAEIKTAVYLTAPMQHVLREERTGKDMRNKAILYNDKTIDDSSNHDRQA